MAMSTARTGLYTSERHQEAREAGKLTAGAMARNINRRLKIDPPVKAAELKPLADEWHHSGFIPGGGMGRTYFFPSDADLVKLAAAVIARRTASPACCWQVRFRKDYSGRYGRKRYVPIAHVFMLAADKVPPAKAIEITREMYDLLSPFEERELESYENPQAFLARMTAQASAVQV